MSIMTQIRLLLIVFLLFLYPIQVFSLQEERVLPNASAEIDEHEPLHSESILLRYTEEHNLMREPEGGASLHIYNDGYAVIYFPSYMQRAGKYGLYLDQSDMERVWALLSSKNILGFNKETIRQRRYAMNQTQEELPRKLSTVSDASTTIIEIYPNRYKSINFGDGSRNAVKKITWYGLKWDAILYLDIPEIQDLKIIQQKLNEIMHRPDLKKID
jgi:hypothetical protein